MNGAGTGMDLYIAARQAQVCRSVMAAVDAVVLGTTTLTARRLPSGSASARTSAAARSGLAGAFFLKEFVKRIFKIFRRVLWEK